MSNIKLRDYQEEGVQGIRAEFRNKNDPVLFVLSAGGGKTYTFSYIAANAEAAALKQLAKRPTAGPVEYILIVVHRKELLLQASASLRNLGIDHGLISPHFSASPHKIIQVASIDTLLLRIKKRPIKVRMLIFDEAHHVVCDNKWGRAYEELGKPPTLGVTATPVRGDGKGLGEGHGGIFKAMVEGPPLSLLIERGVLVKPTVYTSLDTPDLSGVGKNKDGDYNQKELAERVDKPVITGSAVEQYKKVCPGARTVVFCVNVQHAKHVVAEFNAAGFRFALLVGEPHMSDSERTKTDKALRAGDLDGVATVDLISEGYDLPLLDCVIMLRPTESESLFIQQAWRGGRSAPGKTDWWLLDHVGNVGKIVDGVFKRKHGMPDEDRDWNMEGRKKGKGKKKEAVEKGIDLDQCPKCYHVHEPSPTCPKCGHVYEIKGRDIKQVEGELIQVTKEMAAQLSKAKRQEVGMAKSLEDLQRIAAERGYSKHWAKHIWEARNKKKAEPRYIPPPPPTNEQLATMTLKQLEQVAKEQGWPKEWPEQYYNGGKNDQLPIF